MDDKSTVRSTLLEYGAASHIFTDSPDGNDENRDQEVIVIVLFCIRNLLYLTF